MNIPRAIEILTALYQLHQNGLTPLEEDAIKLSIEALKFYKRLEHAAGESYHYPLPGDDPE